MLISDLISGVVISVLYIGIGMRKLTLFAVLAIFFMSCSETKRVTYLQEVESLPVEVLPQKSLLADPRIVPGDLLSISVGSDSPESVSIFNKLSSSSGTTENAMTSSSVSNNSTYLVDNKGIIDFPIIGKLNVGGMTRTEAEEFIKSKIYPQYVKKDPTVTIRVENFKIAVLGEVKTPSIYNVPNERVSVLEAVAMAGDLQLTGRRDNVLLIRFKGDGSKEVARINLNDPNLLFSPYFYLQQNDILYVEPNKSKARTAYTVPPMLTLSLSILSTLLGIANIIVTLTR